MLSHLPRGEQGFFSRIPENGACAAWVTVERKKKLLLKKSEGKPGKESEWAKVLTAEPDKSRSPSPIVEGKSQPPEAVLTSTQQMQAHT